MTTVAQRRRRTLAGIPATLSSVAESSGPPSSLSRRGCQKGNGVSVVGPLHRPCLYGQAECFWRLTLWICQKFSPEHLFEVAGCNCSSSAPHSAVLGLCPQAAPHRRDVANRRTDRRDAPGRHTAQLFEPSLPRSGVWGSRIGASRDAAEGAWRCEGLWRQSRHRISLVQSPVLIETPLDDGVDVPPRCGSG